MKLVEIYQQRDPEPLLNKAMPVDDMIKVASFKTDLPTREALEQAFRLTNDSDEGPWELNPALTVEPGSHASTSIGDVVVVDGEAFQCARNGWSPLPDFKEKSIEKEYRREIKADMSPQSARKAVKWERENRVMLDQHFENCLVDMNTRHKNERQQINAAEDPTGDELLEEKHYDELSRHERIQENAQLRLESMIDDMWRDGVIPEQNFTIPGRNHDLTHDSNGRDDDGGRGGKGR